MTRKPHVPQCHEATPLEAGNLDDLLTRIADTRIAVLGDYCLDIYWFIDPSRSERSLETGLMTQPVREQRYTLGGAGNVVGNLAAIGCRRISVFGVVGNDPWGREMRRLLDAAGVDTQHLMTQDEEWATLAYDKPHVDKQECPRLDFGNFNRLHAATARDLLERLGAMLGQVDLVIVNQQVLQGIHSPELRDGLVRLVADHPATTFIADSRHYTEAYSGCILKINDHEAARLTGVERAPDELVLRDEALGAAEALHRRRGMPLFITRGDRGLLVAADGELTEIPGLQMIGQVDTVGAGDSVLAGVGAGLAAGAEAVPAGLLGNLAAGVTIQKLNQTGTASPDELRRMGAEQAYIYQPELAEDPRQATVLDGTEFEVVRELPPAPQITHAIFDHDGTISTLRQGWEGVMEPMMIRAILGPRYADADESLYRQVTDQVRLFIDQSTGIQTLVQMEGLVKMVRQFECVPEDAIRDAAGYKEVYNTALLEMVRERVQKLERGELDVEDVTIKSAPELLGRLRAAGVHLYLASGTDREDVVQEAGALGYADLFDGGIYGAVGDVRKEAKRIVLDRILSDIGPQAGAGLVTFGDGPVEIRETHKRGGLCVGIASDEVRRYGLNSAKRERLIKAGADLVVPDFSQLEKLLALLRVQS